MKPVAVWPRAEARNDRRSPVQTSWSIDSSQANSPLARPSPSLIRRNASSFPRRCGRSTTSGSDIAGDLPGASGHVGTASTQQKVSEERITVRNLCYPFGIMMKRETFAVDTIYVPVGQRATLDPKRVEEIAHSMLADGQKTPILVRPDGARFVLIEGLHRLEVLGVLPGNVAQPPFSMKASRFQSLVAFSAAIVTLASLALSNLATQ